MKDAKTYPLTEALFCRNQQRVPLWIMRQAGRYLPEYRKLKQTFPNFLTLCKTPHLACEITLQPIHRFDLDAAIIFSDILTIPDAMGLGLEFAQGAGPFFHNPVRDERQIARLVPVDPWEQTGYVMDAIRLVKAELDGKLPLIGFAGSPWTLATYMIEGRGGHDFLLSKKMAFGNPGAMQVLLDKLSLSIANYLSAQIEAGADCVMIFDTWGGVLPFREYSVLSLLPAQRVFRAVRKQHPGIPIIFFTKGADPWLEVIAQSGCDCVGLDWSVDMSRAASITNNKLSIQGNLDPMLLFAGEQRIRSSVREILEDCKSVRCSHVFNLGHGIHKETDPAMVEVFIDEVHSYVPRSKDKRMADGAYLTERR